jgi:hypothetical protein
LAAEAPEPRAALLPVKTLGHHEVDHEVGNTDTGGTGAEDDDPLVAHPLVLRSYGGERGGAHDRGRALDVVVERTDLIAIALQDAVGVGGAEVLPVDHGVGERARHGVDEQVDEGVVAFATHARVALAEVDLVVQQREVVRPDIDDHGDRVVRVDSGRGGVKALLAEADLDPAHTLVADAQDALAVGDDDELDILRLPTER